MGATTLLAACGSGNDDGLSAGDAGRDAASDPRRWDVTKADISRDEPSLDADAGVSSDTSDVSLDRGGSDPDAKPSTDADAPNIDRNPPDVAVHDAGPDAGTIGPVVIDQACAGNLALRVSLLDDRALRLHYVVAGAPQKERGWFTDERGFGGPTASRVDRAGTKVTIATAALILEIASDTCAFAIRDRAGQSLWEDVSGFGADAGSTEIARKLGDGEHIYGLGEKTGSADRRGRSFEMWNSDPAWSDPTGQYRPVSDPIYQSHPFFLSMQKGGRATGAFLANTRRTTFDVGKTVADRLTIGARGGDMDLYFFDGPRPSDVVERYTRLTGRPFLPPLWSLGYHQSRWSYTPSARVEEVGAELRKRHLPADGLWLDIDYMDGFRDFTWNGATFSDPKAMLARLRSSGFKVTAILDPGVKSEPGGQYDAYNTGIADKRFILGADQNPVVREVWPGDAVFPDFTSASVRAWWADLVSKFVASGLRGAWVDMNEPAVFTKDGFPLDARVDGEGQATTFDEVKNVYAMLMARATYEGELRNDANTRPFVLTRAGFAGVQRYAAVWTGDALSSWDHLAMTPAMLTGMSVSGLAFVGSDIGGFSGSPSPELYGRWFEMGSFSPFFRSHVAQNTPDQEPWSFGPEIESVAKRMLGVRYALLPYWYSAFVEATRSGAPLLRPLWFEFPSDEAAHAHDDEFFIGPSLLAAPVTALNVTERDVYLPAGRFYDYYTGASYEGPITVRLPAPLGRVPLLVRAGAVLPTQDVIEYVGAPSSGNRYLDVFPPSASAPSVTTIDEDDGETTAYAKGVVATTQVTTTATANALTIDVSAPLGSFVTTNASTVLRVHGLDTAPKEVREGGAIVAASFDIATRVLTLAPLATRAAHSIVVKYDAMAPAKPRQAALDFTVTLPANTPDGDIYVASSAAGWKPDGVKLTRAGASATGRLSALEGTLVKFKITRATWASVEVTDTCSDVANREVIADFGSQGVTQVNVNVARWVDRCP